MSIITLSTHYGDFKIRLLTDEAPHTSHYFSSLTQTGTLSEAKIFRVVNSENNQIETEHPIHIIQLGPTEKIDPESLEQDKVPHESTSDTGLKHAKWSVSAARFEAGYLYKSLFICMRDEPELDATGLRNSDGKGFAVFGEISDGFEVLEHIFSLAEDDEMLTRPIDILAATITTI